MEGIRWARRQPAFHSNPTACPYPQPSSPTMHPVPLPVAFVSFFTSIFGSFGALPTDPEYLPYGAACLSVLDETSDKEHLSSFPTVLGHQYVYTCRAGSLRLADGVMIEVMNSTADLVLIVHDVYYYVFSVMRWQLRRGRV